MLENPALPVEAGVLRGQGAAVLARRPVGTPNSSRGSCAEQREHTAKRLPNGEKSD